MKIKILFKSSENLVLNFIVTNIILFLKNNYISYSGPIYFPVKNQRFCILNSPNGDKDSRTKLLAKHYKIVIYILYVNRFIINKIMMINVSPMVSIYLVFF